MVNGIMVNVIMVNVIMVNVIMVNVIMVNVIMVNIIRFKRWLYTLLLKYNQLLVSISYCFQYTFVPK